MELRVLKYFLVVSREENVTRAAEILHITQPTLSRQLMLLEQELGVTLFDRSKKKLILTREGMIFKRRAEEMINIEKKIEMELGNKGNELKGEIVIGCGLTEATNTLGDYIYAFKEKYPQVSFCLRNGNSDLIIENIENGLIDIGVVLEPVNLEKLDFMRLNKKERWGLLVRKDSFLARKDYVNKEDLIGIPLIDTSGQGTRGFFRDWAKEVYNQLHFNSSSELTPATSILVKKGIGNAIIIEGSMRTVNSDELCFIPFYPELITSSLIVWKKYNTFGLTISKFIDFMENNNKYQILN